MVFRKTRTQTDTIALDTNHVKSTFQHGIVGEFPSDLVWLLDAFAHCRTTKLLLWCKKEQQSKADLKTLIHTQ